MACAVFIVCVSAVWESVSMIAGWPIVIVSMAIVIARSSARLMFVLFVPYACGSA